MHPELAKPVQTLRPASRSPLPGQHLVSAMHVYLINENDDFPDVELANSEPNGLLATGGDLSVERLLSAYQQGIFPWYSEGEPILWWSPDPRSVLYPHRLKVSRSLRKEIKKQPLQITFDQAFDQVITLCAAPRRQDPNTWITNEMKQAYLRLYDAGYAHSVEAWKEDTLVGGLYGVAIGKVFFGESMFTRVPNASKIAFVYLVRQLQQWGYHFIDCQIKSQHLDSLGATDIPRRQFIAALQRYCVEPHTGAHEQASAWDMELSFSQLIQEY